MRKLKLLIVIRQENISCGKFIITSFSELCFKVLTHQQRYNKNNYGRRIVLKTLLFFQLLFYSYKLSLYIQCIKHLCVTLFCSVTPLCMIMHLSMLSPRGGGGGGSSIGVGHLIFEQIFNQMPHRLAINIGQMPHHFAINCNKYYINKSHSVQIAKLGAKMLIKNMPDPHRVLMIGALFICHL